MLQDPEAAESRGVLSKQLQADQDRCAHHEGLAGQKTWTYRCLRKIAPGRTALLVG